MAQKKPFSWYKILLIIFLISLAIFAVKYRGFGLGDVNEYTVLAENAANPETFGNDWFVNSVQEFNIRKNFIMIVNFFNSFIGNYEITTMLLLFLSVFLFSVGFYNVLFLLTGNYWLSIFGVIFATGINKPAIAGNAFEIGDILISSTLALVVIVWALYFFLKGKYLISFSLVGISSLVHISHAYLAYGILMFALLLKKENLKNKFFSKEELKKKGINILKSLVFFIFFFLAVFPLLSENDEVEKALTSNEIVYLFKFRAPWHYDPSTWGLEIWLTLVLLTILFIFSLRFSKIESKHKKIFGIFVIGVFIYFLLEFVFATLIPTEFMIKVHPFRVNTFFEILISFFIVELAYNKISDMKKKLNKKNSGRLSFLLALVGALILINVYYLSLLSERFSNLLIVRGPLIFVFAFLALIVFVDSAKTKKILSVLLALIIVSYLIYNPLIGRHSYDDQTQELYSFVQENIPEDAVLLTNPKISTSRLGTGRAIVVDHKAFPYSDKAIAEWYDRVLDITNSQGKRYESGVHVLNDVLVDYDSLTKENVLVLKEKYGFSYAVFDSEKELDFEKAFENEEFVFYMV